MWLYVVIPWKAIDNLRSVEYAFCDCGTRTLGDIAKQAARMAQLDSNGNYGLELPTGQGLDSEMTPIEAGLQDEAEVWLVDLGGGV